VQGSNLVRNIASMGQESRIKNQQATINKNPERRCSNLGNDARMKYIRVCSTIVYKLKGKKQGKNPNAR
jgi:hypothetical protein